MGSDWNPSNTFGEMSDVGDGLYLWEVLLPAGDWQYKVVLNQGWDQDTYGGGGNFFVNSDGVTPTMFYYDFKQNSTYYILAESGCTSLGDVNGDSNVDILDVVSMVNFVLGNLEEISCADYNEDGGVDILDIVNVVSLILGN